MTMKFSKLLFAVSALVAATVSLASPVRIEGDGFVLFSPNANDGEQRLVVIVPGATKAAKEYETLAQKISDESRMRIWTAILEMPLNMPNPLLLGSKVENVVSTVSAQGEQISLRETFVAGHSLGGIVAQEYAKKHDIGGLVLLGSYITRGNRSAYAASKANFPVLTIGGELDGQTRLTRIAKEAEITHALVGKGDLNSTMRTRPTVVIPGANHAAFANGIPMKNDFQAEADYGQSQSEIALAVNDFVLLASTNSTDLVAEKRMSNRMNTTFNIFEGYWGTKTVTQNWCENAQRLTLGMSDNYSVTQNVFPGLFGFVGSKPSVSGKDIQVNVRFNRVRNLFDVSTNPEEANSVDCKMKTNEAVVAAQAYTSSTVFSESCNAINERAYTQVLNALSPNARDRFLKKGQPLRFGSDRLFGTGMQWVASRLDVSINSNGEVVVQSPALRTDLNAPERFAGMFYCKLLSPARIAEWMLVDGLRK